MKNSSMSKWLHPFWALIPAAAIGTLATWATMTHSWAKFGVYTMTPDFADLRQVTSTADCVASDPHWSITSFTCDPFHRDYNYPSFWARAFAFFGWGQSSTDTLGIAFIALFVMCIGVIAAIALSGKRASTIVVVTALAAVSPPVYLILERGNIDIVILAILTLTIVLYQLRQRTVSTVLLGFATFLKVFPAGSALLLFVDREHRKLRLLLYGVLAVVGFVLLLPEYAIIVARTPQQFGGSFGVSVLPYFVNPPFFGDTDQWSRRILGLGLFLAALILLALILVVNRRGAVSRAWNTLVARLRADRTASILVLAGGGSLLAGYLVGTSWDYRLIFTIPLVAGLARITRKESRLALPLIIVFVLEMYATFPIGPFEPIPDVVWLVLAPVLAILLLQTATGIRVKPIESVSVAE